MKKILMTLALPAAALALEILPFSAAAKFAVGPEESQIKTFSFFDLFLWGSGTFSPLIVGVMTVLAVVLGAVCLIKKSKAVLSAQIGAAALGLVALVLELAKGAEAVTVFGAIIALLLLGQCILGWIMMFKDEK